MANDNAPLEKQTSKKYKTLLDKRSNAIRALDYHGKKVNAIDKDTTQTEALTRIVSVEQCYEKYKKLNDELEESSDFSSEDLVPPNEEVTEAYIHMISKLKEFTKESIDSPLSTSMLNSTANHTMRFNNSHDVHLPRIFPRSMETCSNGHHFTIPSLQ